MQRTFAYAFLACGLPVATCAPPEPNIGHSLDASAEPAETLATPGVLVEGRRLSWLFAYGVPALEVAAVVAGDPKGLALPPLPPPVLPLDEPGALGLECLDGAESSLPKVLFSSLHSSRAPSFMVCAMRLYTCTHARGC